MIVNVFQIRVANRCRQRLRPVAPTDLSFELEVEKLPTNFFRHDVKVKQRRHIIFATDQQLALLAKARRWYIDGTFYVVREPFKQLVTIHAFIKYEGNLGLSLYVLYFFFHVISNLNIF